MFEKILEYAEKLIIDRNEETPVDLIKDLKVKDTPYIIFLRMTLGSKGASSVPIPDSLNHAYECLCSATSDVEKVVYCLAYIAYKNPILSSNVFEGVFRDFNR